MCRNLTFQILPKKKARFGPVFVQAKKMLVSNLAKWLWNKTERQPSPLICFSWLVSTQHSCGLRFGGKSSVPDFDLWTSIPLFLLAPSLRPQTEGGLQHLFIFFIHNESSHLVCVCVCVCVVCQGNKWCLLISLSIRLLIFLRKQVAHERAPILLVFAFKSLVLRLSHQRINLSKNNSRKIQSIMSFWLLAGVMLKGYSFREQ